MGNGSEETGRSVWVRHQARSEGGSAFPQQTGQSKSEQNSENCGRVVNVGQHSAKLLGKRNGLLRRDSRKGASNHKGEYSSHIALLGRERRPKARFVAERGRAPCLRSFLE